MILDEYDILKKKSKKTGFAAFDLLIYIAIVLLAIIIFAFIIGKIRNSKTTETSSDNEKTSGNEVVKLDGKAARIYYENLKDIKDAAISYFTNERLPQEKGEKVKLTLKKMQDKKLVLDLVDSKDNLCDGEKSYVEVEKDSNEYVMKIYLSCSDKEDYIIVHLGCYDYCKDNICEKEDEKGETEFEYEYKKTVDCVMTDWSKWGDWTKIRQAVSKFKKEDTKTETKKEEYLDVTDAKQGEVTYSCDEYPGYKLSGNLCIKEISEKEVIPATEGEYSYNCDEYPGYVVEGSTCVKTVEKTDTKKATVITGDYYCPEGYTLSGKVCVKKVTDTETKAATEKPGEYTCPEGYKKSGTECTKTVSKTDTKAATEKQGGYTCPEGYKKSGTECTRTVSKTDTKAATAKYDSKKEYYGCYKNECTTKTEFNCDDGVCGMKPQSSCEYVLRECERDVDYISGYICPDGYNLTSDNKCTRKYDDVEKIPATQGKTTYTCPDGYDLTKDNKCTRKYDDVEKIPATQGKTTYTCPDGYDLTKDNKCTRKYTKEEKVDASKYEDTYKCSKGYVLENNVCVKEVIEKYIRDAKKVSGGYSCKEGYILNNDKCEKTISSTDTKNAKANEGGYICPEGYALNGTKCSKKINKTVKITYYRYATRNCVDGSVDTVWSYANNKELLDDGYKLTGNKREIQVTEK